MAIGGLDIGTTGCKITVYDDLGNFLCRSYRDYPVLRSISEHEVYAENVWSAVKEAIKEAAGKVSGIKAIGITSFGESFVLLDKSDKPLLPSMLYTDPRGAQECEDVVSKIGKDRIAEITGLNAHIMYSLPKLLWIKNNHRDIFDRAKHVLLFQDYIVYMLSGNAQIDYSLATRTMAFDIRNLVWSREILETAEIDINLLSKPVPSGTGAGRIKPEIAGELGLSAGTLIVSCCHDQVAAATGAGVFESGRAIDGTGTVECITPVFDEIKNAAVLHKGNYAIVPHAIPGKYVCYAFSFTGGALVKWFIDHLAGYEKTLADRSNRSVYEVLEAGMNEKPTGILVLPHFAGAATPYMDSDSKGCIVGLTLSTTAADIYKAIMEGVTYEMLINMEQLSLAGIHIDMLRAAGGGAASRVWLQIKADILNVPVISLGTSEAGAAGSVMLTGVAAGVFESLSDASKLMTKELETFYPRSGMHEEYMKIYEKYRNLYQSVRPLV